MVYDIISAVTSLFLVVIFVAAHLLSWTKQRSGTIICMDPSKDSSSLKRITPGVEMEVRLDSGRVVRAESSHCAICLNGIDVGSRVAVSEIGDRMVLGSCCRRPADRGLLKSPLTKGDTGGCRGVPLAIGNNPLSPPLVRGIGGISFLELSSAHEHKDR